MKDNQVFLLLGANLGNRLEFLEKAKREIDINVGNIVEQSSVYESEAWGYSSNNNFYNQVIEIQSALSPTVLLQEIKLIEKRMGRIKSSNTSAYEDRVIDIDILFYNTDIIKTNTLEIPHKEIKNRKFVLLPLVELNPEMLHPDFNETMKSLLSNTKDHSKVWVHEV